MLRRPLDRIELKPEDKQELEDRQIEDNPASKEGDQGRYATESKTDATSQQPAAPNVTVEVEVKVKLLRPEDHAKAEAIFAPYYATTYNQENFFFDGSKQELSSKNHILRIRFYNKTEKAVLTIKGRMNLADGIGRATEMEEDVDVDEARRCIEQPDRILHFQSELVQNKKREFEIEELICLGGFENIRKEFKWEGYKLELDETKYDFGTNYEIECETDHPEELRNRLEGVLKENGIQHKYKTSTKFACFINRSLADD